MKIFIIGVLILSCVFLRGTVMADRVPVYSYQILNMYPHDPSAFTQGLCIEEGMIYEGTGGYGRSYVAKKDLETGNLLKTHHLEDHFFGEGITLYKNQIIQLTWKSKKGFVYDKTTFNLLKTFDYPTEGWGITHDGNRLIMSDGTSALYFLDPQTLKPIGKLSVHEPNSRPVTRINELEYVEGEIFANIWQTDLIARISLQTGMILGWIDLSGLYSFGDLRQSHDVLNGIAYDSMQKRLFVTGKLWQNLFEIQLIKKSDR